MALSRRATRMTSEALKLKGVGTFHKLSRRPPSGQESNPTPHGGERERARLSLKKKIKEALMDNGNRIIGIYGMNVDDNTALAREIEKEVEDEKLFEEVAFEVKDPRINKKIQDRLEGIDGNKRILVILDDVPKEIVIPSSREHQGLKIMFTTLNDNIFTRIEFVDKKFVNGDQSLKDTARISDDEDRSSIKQKIKEALMDKEISIIGICGMPGVGKTTMANEIVKEIQSEKLFKDVAFAVVSEHPDVDKIQDQLADMLDLTIEQKTNKDVRAERLRRRLESKDDDKTVLVILDDVWKEIDLGTIGIPSPRGRKSLKIMFTTRIEDTCTKMEVDKKFEIKVLGENEGWKILKRTAGISDEETDVELLSTAKKVAHECGGLPLALVVVGKALKCKNLAAHTHKWRDALQQLQNSNVTNLEGMHKLVYSKIELSYNYLESNEDRELLLLCSLFAEDKSIPIENLFRYARGLDLFPNTGTLNETRDRVYSIADNLKNCYLLQPGKKEDRVKLHDVIRDFCLQMATKDKCGYLVNHAGLKEWPELDADESYRVISITFDKLDQLPGGLKYQNVKLLRVICRYMGERNNSEEFFQYMKELRVLELKKMPFPSSIKMLTGLRTLCLISCELDPQLSMIGSLKKLEILCLYDSYFGASVPKESANFGILNLSNLKSLDLRFRRPYPLLPGVLSGMKKLEELYLGDYIPMEGEDQRYIIIEELRSLNSLRAFQISTRDNQILKQILGALSLENLENFQIFTGAPFQFRFLSLFGIVEDSTEDDRFTRGLYLYGNDTENLQPEINSLMKRTYHLQIENARVLKNVVSELDGDGFINLKTLRISRGGDFEYLIDAANSIPSGTFGKLESLELHGLPKLTEICNGNLPRVVFKPPLFCNLMVVRMSYCDAIRSLFRESVAKCLVNLQSLHIYYCSMLEEVVSMDAQENEVTKTCKMLEFPKLKQVELIELTSFKSFTSQSNGEVFCQTLFNQVTFPIMEDLYVGRLDCIVKLFGKEMPSYLYVDGLVSKGIRVFQNLTKLTVADCERLRYLFSPSIVNSLGALERLSIENCKALEEIIGREEEEEEEEEENNDGSLLTLSSQVTLPNLKYLAIKRLQCIVKLVSIMTAENSSKSLQNLEIVEVKECKALEVLFDFECLAVTKDHAESALGRLRSLELNSLDKLVHITWMVSKGIRVFQNLTNLTVKDCESLRYLFSPSLINSLGALERLSIENCKALEEIIGREEEENNDGSLLTLFNQVTLPNLKYLAIKRLQCIVKLVSIMTAENSSKSLQNLEQVEVKECKALEVLFDFECLAVTKDHAESALGRLRSLELNSLDKLVHITWMVSKGIRVFQNLTNLTVKDCESLRYLFSPSLINSLGALERLSIENCKALEEIIGREEEENNDGSLLTLFNQVTLPNLKYLAIKRLQRIVKLVSIMTAENSSKSLQNLERVEVKECKALKVLFDFECLTVRKDAKSTLGRLRSLELNSLDKLVHITRMVPNGIRVFQNLTNLSVEDCESLRYLFSPSIVNSLVALERLSIENCKALDEIIGREEKENNDGSLLTLFNQVTLPNLKYLAIKRLQCIVKLVSIMTAENSSKSLQNLEQVEVKECKALEVLFDFECLAVTKDHAESALGRLRSLELKSLDKLVCITRMVPKGIRVFQNLTSLVVERCGSLKYLFSPSMANSLGALNILKVSDCQSIEEIVAKEEEEEGTLETKIFEGMKIKLVFLNLNRLLLKNLPRIQMFCSENYERVFLSTKNLTVENCPMMPKLIPWPVSAPNL